jgi:hypothetical protein
LNNKIFNLDKQKIMNRPAQNIISQSLLIITFLLAFSVTITAEDLRKIVNLSGSWKFSVGDDKTWANPDYDDSDWDVISVPSRWEDQGYNDYNGYAWYRKTFIVNDFTTYGDVYLRLGKIDDVDEVYFNGKLIGGRGSFPPKYETAYDQDRKYIVPKDLIKINGENVIAIEVFDEYMEGGVVAGPVGMYIDEDINFLDLIIVGNWKFHLGDNKQWSNPDYDDSGWENIAVPQEWDNQGYGDYDGYAWYRRNFKVPNGFIEDNMYLSLGRIDDYDYVYVNGKLIGSVFDLEKDKEYRHKGAEYRARRVYKIPNGLIKEGVNIIAVRVYDQVWRGGIYEGPIGIMKESNYKKYHKKNYSNQPFWDFIFDEFIAD